MWVPSFSEHICAHGYRRNLQRECRWQKVAVERRELEDQAFRTECGESLISSIAMQFGQGERFCSLHLCIVGAAIRSVTRKIARCFYALGLVATWTYVYAVLIRQRGLFCFNHFICRPTLHPSTYWKKLWEKIYGNLKRNTVWGNSTWVERSSMEGGGV